MTNATAPLTLAIRWTGENTGAIAVGAGRDEALAALTEANPGMGTRDVEYVEATPRPGGGWAATIDP